MRNFFPVIILLIAVKMISASQGDTTWVTAFNREFQNHPDTHFTNVTFPDTIHHWEKIIMTYKLACPDSGCDPWDRMGWIRLYQDSVEYELGRIITPYNIVGGNKPGTCTFFLDVTVFMSILHNSQKLGSYIESWIGGKKGWLVTVKFAFIEGEPDYIPFKVINLWQNHHIIYGDPSNPHENYLQPITVFVEPGTEKAVVRIITTGHGQGDKSNAAEFINVWHSLKTGKDSIIFNIWKNDCKSNPCSPQGGTWTEEREGWCPGSAVVPWTNEITDKIITGKYNKLDYDIQPYINYCRPDNSDCITGVTCEDCNYNYNGHTEPFWNVESQLILYKFNTLAEKKENGTLSPFKLEQNFPNPFNGVTKIPYIMLINSKVKISILDSKQKEMEVLINDFIIAGSHSIEFDSSKYPAGIYYYKFEAGEFTVTKKMVIMK